MREQVPGSSSERAPLAYDEAWVELITTSAASVAALSTFAEITKSTVSPYRYPWTGDDEEVICRWQKLIETVGAFGRQHNHPAIAATRDDVSFLHQAVAATASSIKHYGLTPPGLGVVFYPKEDEGNFEVRALLDLRNINEHAVE